MNDIAKMVSQLERQKTAIEKAILALREGSGLGIEESKTTRAGRSKTVKVKRHLSPEGRKRIAEAARRRWAAKRVAEKNTAKESSSAKRTRPARKAAA